MASSRTSTPRSRSSTASTNLSDTTMNDAPPLTPVRPRPTSHGTPTTSPQPGGASSSFNLLVCPREIRELVYGFALVSPFPFWWPSGSSPKHNVAWGLLTVNRQVHAEATPLLYAMNKFLFTHPSDCNIFRVIASPFAANITSVYLRIRDKDVKLWTRYLGSKQAERSMQADLPKLKNLCIFLKCSTISAPAIFGQLGAAQAGNVGPAVHVPTMHQALGGQVIALQQQVQNQIHALQQQVHLAIGQASALANPTPIPPVPMPFAQFAHTAHTLNTSSSQPLPLPHPHLHPHGQVNNPPPNPSPLAQHLAANTVSIAPVPPVPLQTPATQYHHHQPFSLFGSFLRFEREMGLESLCLSLHEIRPVDADIKIICIVKLPRHDLQRLLTTYAGELSIDRNGDARSKFRRVHGVDVSLEVGGYEVGG